MTMPPVLHSEKGQLLEAVIATVFVGLVILGIAVVMVHHSQTTTRLKRFDQSKQLADMVFEQYNSWTGSQTSGSGAMTQNNVTNVPAGTFFGVPGSDMGFHGMLLTTLATCQGNLSTDCTVNVKVSSTGGETRTYSRTYSAQMTDHSGAAVDVWVLNPACNPSKPELFSTCGGLGGFLVTAKVSAIYIPGSGKTNLFGTSEAVAYTQADGHAVLRNVATNIPMLITARQAGSAVYDLTSNPTQLTQGYYVAGTTLTTASQLYTALPYQTNVVPPFQSFLPLGTISGTLSNTDDGTVASMMVVLQSTASTGFGLRYNPTWNVLTDGSGNFKFINVLPGPFTLYAAGDPGTQVAIPPVASGNPFNFRQGYSSHHAVSGALATPAAWNAPTSVSGLSLPIRKLGALHLNVSASWMAAHPGDHVGVMTRLPPTLFRHSILISSNTTSAPMPLDFYNVFDDANSSITLMGVSLDATNHVDGYFTHLVAQGLNPAVDNTVTITPSALRSFQGTLKGIPSGGIPASGITISCAGGVACTDVLTPMHDGQTFTFSHFMPELNGPATNQFLLKVDDAPSAPPPNSVHASGPVTDVLENAPVDNVTLVDKISAPTAITTSNAAGNYLLNINSSSHAYYVLVTFTCPASPSVPCTTLPVAGSATPGPILVDTALIGGNVWVDSRLGGTWMQYYQYPGSFIHTDTQNVTIPRYLTLTYYGLTGTVVDAVSRVPVRNILVCDKSYQLDLSQAGVPFPNQPNPPFNGQCVSTNNAGQYSFVVNGARPLSVSNRYRDTSTGTFNSGFVEVYVPNNQFSSNGKSYSGGDSGIILIPVPAHYIGSPNYVPLTANPIVLSPNPGSI